jgi:predicted RNase H-like nuclease (RuvC/YqgF family)
MPQEMIHIGARIPKELFDKCKTKSGNITSAIIDGLNLLCKTDCKTQENNCKTSMEEFERQIEERDVKIEKLQLLNDSLVKKLENHKELEIILELQNIRVQDLQDQLKVKDQQQEARIADLKEQIQALNEQINKKDKLLEELNQTLMAQASNIYNLTQNPKLLPENKVKRWYEFWKN